MCRCRPRATPSQRVPTNLKDPNGLWFGLSKRVRAIAYNKAAGLPIDVNRYEDLANPSLTGSVCMRSSSNIYNLSLMSSIIESAGEAAAEAWASGVVKNFGELLLFHSGISASSTHATTLLRT